MNRRTPAEWLVDADATARELPFRAISLLRTRTLRLLSVLGFGTLLMVMLGSQPAMADPGCGDIPVVSGICSTITGTISFATDPTGYIAGQIKSAVGSLLGEFAHLIQATTTVDFSNTGFLQTYAIGFGIASVLTIILWLIAVAKRAVAGAGPVEALGESIGYLMLSVAVTAFMPLAVALVVSLVDDATDAALSPMLGNIGAIGNTVTSAWGPVAGMSGGNVLMAIIGILMLVAAAGVWLELVIRSALIYLGLALGVMVFSGLVDKSLWSHTKKWIGLMAGIILSKYVTLTTLALATGLLANDNSSDVDTCLGIVLTALALFYLAMLAPMTLGRLIPVIGDDMAAAHSARAQAQGQIAGLPAQMNSASEMIAGRGGGSGGGSGGDSGEAESGEQDAGTGAEISGAKNQATGTANTSSGSGDSSGAQSETDGGDLVAQGANGEAVPAEGAGAGAAGTTESGAAEAGVAEEAAVAGGPIAAAAVAAEKVEETAEKAVSAAVDRSSGGQVQQDSATPGASSAAGTPSSAGLASSGSVSQQQAPASSATPQTSPQEQAAPEQSQQPPPAAPSTQQLPPPAAPSAQPPSSSSGPTAPPPSGPTPA